MKNLQLICLFLRYLAGQRSRKISIDCRGTRAATLPNDCRKCKPKNPSAPADQCNICKSRVMTAERDAYLTRDLAVSRPAPPGVFPELAKALSLWGTGPGMSRAGLPATRVCARLRRVAHEKRRIIHFLFYFGLLERFY
jgi:hypothetical protein